MLRQIVLRTRHLIVPDNVTNFAPSSYKICRYFCDHRNNFVGKSEKQDEETQVSGAFAAKYRIFRDEESPIILDVEEERLISGQVSEDLEAEEDYDEFYGLNLSRGVTGVFEVEDLVNVLRRENMLDIFVVSVPPEFKYVNYMVIVTGKSQRHMYATAEFVRRVFKKKRHSNDSIPEIEGKDSKDWIAMDLGNIALHIFSKKARVMYDLESLWSVGPEYDRLINKKDDAVVEFLMEHSLFLGDIKPTETKG